MRVVGTCFLAARTREYFRGWAFARPDPLVLLDVPAGPHRLQLFHTLHMASEVSWAAVCEGNFWQG